MFDDDRERAGRRPALAETGTFANLHRLFSEVASPAPHLKTRHTPVVDGRRGTAPEPVRVLRDGLQTDTGLTADGRHA